MEALSFIAHSRAKGSVRSFIRGLEEKKEESSRRLQLSSAPSKPQNNTKAYPSEGYEITRLNQ